MVAMKRRGGFSLIEVVAGLVMMATVMAASLKAFADHQQRIRHANDRRRAVGLCDELLGELTTRRGGLPVAADGRWPASGMGGEAWRWRLQTIDAGLVWDVPTRTVRLQIFGGDGRELVHVDLLWNRS